jgi:hypothetical protein
MAPPKKKPKKTAKKTKKRPTLAGLTKQVEAIRLWVMVLKDAQGLGAVSYEDFLKAHPKPNSSGGPPPYPP